MFSACTTYEKQLRIEKTRLSHQVWSHGGSTFKKKRTLNGHFSRPAETDPYVQWTKCLDKMSGQNVWRKCMDNMYEHNVCTICMNKMYDKYPLFFSGNERSTPCRRACPPSNCRPPCCSTLLAASGTRAPGWWLLILMWPWCVKMLGSRNLYLLMLNCIFGFVKLFRRICQNCDEDLLKLLHVFTKQNEA